MDRGGIMTKVMELGDIYKRYKDEWLLIEYEQLDEDLNVTKGKVVAHSRDKSQILQQLVQIQGRNIAIEYAGAVPEDLAVLL